MPQGTNAPKPGEAPTEPVLDLDHLRSFTEDDPQLERELSTLFLATAEMYLQQMEEALTGGRPWSPIAHSSRRSSTRLKSFVRCSRSASRAEGSTSRSERARSGQKPLDLNVH